MIRKAVQSVGFYPLTALYLAGVTLGLLVARHNLTLMVALLIFTLSAVGALLFATWRELQIVHRLVDGQRTEMLARIDDLTARLDRADEPIPPSGPHEQEARREVTP